MSNEIKYTKRLCNTLNISTIEPQHKYLINEINWRWSYKGMWGKFSQVELYERWVEPVAWNLLSPMIMEAASTPETAVIFCQPVQGVHKRMVRFQKLIRNLFFTLHGHNVHRQQRKLSKFLMRYQQFASHA